MRICSCTGGLPSHQNITRRVSLSECGSCGSVYHHLITIFSKHWLRPHAWSYLISRLTLYRTTPDMQRHRHRKWHLKISMSKICSKEIKHKRFSSHEIIVILKHPLRFMTFMTRNLELYEMGLNIWIMFSAFNHFFITIFLAVHSWEYDVWC